MSNHSKSPQNHEDSRRQGPQKQKGRKTTSEKQPSTPPKAKKYEPMDSDEDDEEPRNEPGTSSNSHTTVPVLPLHQGPGASSQGPAASSQGPPVRKNSTLTRSLRSKQMVNFGQRRLKHASVPQQLDHFVLLRQKKEISRTYTICPLCRVYNDHRTSMR